MDTRKCIGKCLFNTLKMYTISYNFFNNWIFTPFISNFLSYNKNETILNKYEIQHNNKKQSLFFDKKEIQHLETSNIVNYYKISDVQSDNSINCVVPCTFNLLNVTLIHYGISYEIIINNDECNFCCQYNKIDPFFIKWYVRHFFKTDIICDSNTSLSFIDQKCELKEINLVDQSILLEKDDYKIINN